MSPVQIIAAVIFIVVMVAVYARPLLALLPAFAVPESKTNLMEHVEQVVSIRSTYRTADVEQACNQLLHVLLGVKQ